jgi:bifunctional DNase/RNase
MVIKNERIFVGEHLTRSLKMQKIKLNILGLSVSQTQSGAYALVLAEEHGDRRIPIIIAIQMEGLKPPRPLTHDLIRNIALAFEITLLEVIIHKLEEGIFFSELLCEMEGKEVRIDSRTSDAIALALRFRCPIYTTEEILKKAGIVLEMNEEHISKPSENETRPPKYPKTAYEKYTLADLEAALSEAIQQEDYEKASLIRDEIKRRK